MAKNDVVLIDGILEQRRAEALPSSDPGEVFEYLALEQVLKDFDLSRDEIESGWVDGQDDGGIDGFFTIINGQLLRDAERFAWPKAGASIEVWLFTCKHHDTFEQAPINFMLASLQELLDFSLTREQFKGTYSDEIIRARSTLLHAYKKLSILGPDLAFKLFYVSRGDVSKVAENVSGRARQAEALIRSSFSSCTARFDFVGAAELVELSRRAKRFSLDLPFVEDLSGGKGSYVLLVPLDEYCRFVTDEQGHLRRYLFDSNVRDFMRGSPVNEDISASLRSGSGPDFWWLNNGVTILATGAAIVGKTIALQNIQIVNGLQTTETIFRHFQQRPGISDSRALLVKVLVSTDASIRDAIIRATNNQNAVELSSLHATDKIQRDIEEVLERGEWFYERRKNYYRNIGKPPARFVTPMYLASCVVSLIFKNPAQAARLKIRFVRRPNSYAAVFSEDFPIGVWPIIVSVMRRVEEGLALVRPSNSDFGDRFLAKWRALVSLMCVAKIMKTFDYSTSDLLSLDPGLVTPEIVAEAWEFVRTCTQDFRSRKYRNPSFVVKCCESEATALGLPGVVCVGKRQMPAEPTDLFRPITLSDAYLEAVKELLSQSAGGDQVAKIARQLNTSRRKVRHAIYLLQRAEHPDNKS